MWEWSDEVILERLRSDNPWWDAPHNIPEDLRKLSPRPYLDVAWPLLSSNEPRRAFVLLGTRRVGKTVLLHHAIERLLRENVDPTAIQYLSLDTPSFTGIPLDQLLRLAQSASNRADSPPAFVIFDEIQYLKDWERHLKRLVDTERATKFIVSGSAAAALRLRSVESGAGRFSDFHLPPLTFGEYLTLRGESGLIDRALDAFDRDEDRIDLLNDSFVRYLNFGGFPELAARERELDARQFVRHDVIDKVLLRDLPSLYGIDDITELNQLFNVLAYQTAQELTMEALSRQSGGVSKNTIKKYLDYLQAAFLIDIVHRVDRDARRFQRATRFKVYVTNPSMRAALFKPEPAEGSAMGALVETGLFAQYSEPRKREIHYARWDKSDEGEVDFVTLTPDGRASRALEVKWSDRYFDDPEQLTGLAQLTRAHQQLRRSIVTTRTRFGVRTARLGEIAFVPSALWAVMVSGATVAEGKDDIAARLAKMRGPASDDA